MAMLNKGEKSGKGEKQYYYEGNEDSDGGWWNAGSSNQSDTDGLLSKKEKKDKRKGRGRRNEKAYETALYTAGESQGRYGYKRGKGGRNGKGDGMSDVEIVVATAMTTVAVSVIIFALILCCMRKRSRGNTNPFGMNESELSRGGPSNSATGVRNESALNMNDPQNQSEPRAIAPVPCALDQ